MDTFQGRKTLAHWYTPLQWQCTIFPILKLIIDPPFLCNSSTCHWSCWVDSASPFSPMTISIINFSLLLTLLRRLYLLLRRTPVFDDSCVLHPSRISHPCHCLQTALPWHIVTILRRKFVCDIRSFFVNPFKTCDMSCLPFEYKHLDRIHLSIYRGACITALQCRRSLRSNLMNGRLGLINLLFKISAVHTLPHPKTQRVWIMDSRSVPRIS